MPCGVFKGCSTPVAQAMDDHPQQFPFGSPWIGVIAGECLQLIRTRCLNGATRCCR
jgi:hypothetical protein